MHLRNYGRPKETKKWIIGCFIGKEFFSGNEWAKFIHSGEKKQKFQIIFPCSFVMVIELPYMAFLQDFMTETTKLIWK